MDNTYAIIISEDGELSEHILGDHNAGFVLSHTFYPLYTRCHFLSEQQNTLSYSDHEVIDSLLFGSESQLHHDYDARYNVTDQE